MQEQCDNCGELVGVGYLAAYANDFTDLRNGKVLLCRDCGKVWREAWRTVVQWTRNQSDRAFRAWLSNLGKRSGK
jgi:hypothetical protein